MNQGQDIFDRYCSYEARESGLSIVRAQQVVLGELEKRAMRGDREALEVIVAAAQPWINEQPPCPHEGFQHKETCANGMSEQTYFHKIPMNGEEDGQLRQAKVVPGAAEAVQRVREAGIV